MLTTMTKREKRVWDAAYGAAWAAGFEKAKVGMTITVAGLDHVTRLAIQSADAAVRCLQDWRVCQDTDVGEMVEGSRG